ncbi:CAP domain-containing protein [Aquibacillus kalidii]|uniref:CAP domain-containing protein n=1 Tax=Aquibacillus kalidii TaxID=2762597 RepID=UPI001645FE2F|nr:CAP domain-containing protein [Aquibacillus kalidii]
MKKQLLISVVVGFCLLLVACNSEGSNLGMDDSDRTRSVNQENAGNLNVTNVRNDNIPVRPGREQNIFGGPSINRGPYNNVYDGEETTNPSQNIDNPDNTKNDFQTAVIELTNQVRRENGLTPLELEPTLAKVAQEKAEDMAANDYFSHTSPTYGSPFDMLKQFGISYTAAAENIALGQQTPQEVMDGWMNSPGHRENIMDPDVTHIGVGYTIDGYYWTQLFIKK